ncbi:MAG: phosphoribosylanthranilate isomerase [Candidatus Sumerlaeota bacterium]|nr:phosphoribosylanthranilate isomerase [Candidatus Sumerlaeota bacterium]
METRIKICCISTVGEARLAIIHGAFAVGLVSSMPSGPGVIAEDKILKIASVVPPGVAAFLLTSNQQADAIIEQQRRCRVNTLQICDRLPPGHFARLRDALPGIALVQVIHVTGEESLDEAARAAREADALLLDSGRPGLTVKELGGTGRTHDWQISRRIRDAAGIPVYLAGGLTPGNVAEAINAVRPFAVDVCSGVRTNGKLHKEKLIRFIASVKAADRRHDGKCWES